jgi:hypothetical protein
VSREKNAWAENISVANPVARGYISDSQQRRNDMASKIDTLANTIIANNDDTLSAGYAHACGSLRALANMMMEDLSPEKRAFYERVIDGLISDNA